MAWKQPQGTAGMRIGRAALGALLLLLATASAAAGQVEEDQQTQARQDVSSDLSLDRETVLLALALENSGGVNIDIEDLLEGDVVEERVVASQRGVQLDEDTTFSALALDMDLNDLLLSSDSDGDGSISLSELDSLEDDELSDLGLSDGDISDLRTGGGVDVGDEDTVLVQRRAESRGVTLDRDDVFLALALQNSLGGDLDFEDVADLDRSVVVDQDLQRAVDIDDEDAFLALALDGDGDDGGLRLDGDGGGRNN